MRQGQAAGVILLLILSVITTPAAAHRLDEYIQATTISLTKDRVQAQVRLTPGVAVSQAVLAGMDADADGVLSAAEQRAYAERVRGDLSLRVNSRRLPLRLVSWTFAETTDMREGRGEIVLNFDAALPRASGPKRLIFEDHHQSRIAAYLVNCLIPTDPDIQITAQDRNHSQSFYQLDYVQTGVVLGSPSPARQAGVWGRLGAGALLLLCTLLAGLWRRGTRKPSSLEDLS